MVVKTLYDLCFKTLPPIPEEKGMSVQEYNSGKIMLHWSLCVVSLNNRAEPAQLVKIPITIIESAFSSWVQEPRLDVSYT